MKGRNKQKNGGDGLESQVLKVKFLLDKKGRFFYLCDALRNFSIREPGRRRAYVPICGYKVHEGVIEKLNVCNSRACRQIRRIALRESNKEGNCNQSYKIYVRNGESKGNKYVNNKR
jgi:hypothetical protein|tara:strand:- start:244 stop:594 length:351 start_codon:yes stop_codon:yes gene_type:complete